MGLLNKIKHWQIKSFIKGACRAMLISFGAFEHQLKKGKIEAKLYGDLAAKSLSTRPKWKHIDKDTFQYSSGEKLKIKKSDSLADVALSVILIEMREFIFNDNHPDKILKLIVSEFQKFFSVSDDFLRNHKLLNKLTKEIQAETVLRNTSKMVTQEKPKILMFEDDSLLSQLLKEKFLEGGFDFKGFDSYENVVDIVIKEKPDIILCDIIMPEIDGYQAMKMLKKDKRTKDFPIVIYDNMCMKEDIEKALKLGAIDHLCKAHYTPNEVIEKVKQHLIVTGKFGKKDF